MSSPSFSLEGQVALVTGAGRGLGRAISLGLAQAGADLVITSRTVGELQSLAAEVRAKGRRCRCFTADLSRVREIEPLVEAAWSAFGGIDVLVNNAGVSIVEPAAEVSEEHWDLVLDLNLKGLFFVAQAVGRRMLERGSGKIVNMASQAGVVGLANHAAYCASKGGVVLLTKVLALEWASRGITVNAVAPTVIRTPMSDRAFADPEARADVLRRIPLGRIGEPSDVVGAVVFLASPAADLITGTTLLVDGGWTAQ